MANDVHMGGFNILPPVVKNLLIINGLFFFAKIVFSYLGIDMDAWFGLHYFGASDFRFWQPFTYMFMHGSFGHLFFNMFALWMFGNAIENYWGAKKFLIYYFVTGIGAGLIHYVVLYFQIQPELATINQFIDAPSLDHFSQIVNNHKFVYYKGSPEMNALQDAWSHVLASPGSQRALNDLAGLMVDYREYYLNAHNIVGASGAVFGLLLAFGMLFPNAQIYIYFLLPIKAKWFVILYGALELVYGVTGSQDGVAHFAHLGGMLFGILLILLWRKKERREQGYTDFYEY